MEFEKKAKGGSKSLRHLRGRKAAKEVVGVGSYKKATHILFAKYSTFLPD